jgi:hypothetical protein
MATNTSMTCPDWSIAPVHVAPPPSDLHIGLVHLPAIADPMSAGPSSLGQQRREPLHPPIDGDVVDLDATLSQELFDVAVGQTEAQVPADRDDDDIGWEAKAGESRAGTWSQTRAASSHAGSLAPRRRSP